MRPLLQGARGGQADTPQEGQHSDQEEEVSQVGRPLFLLLLALLFVPVPALLVRLLASLLLLDALLQPDVEHVL